MQYTIKKGTNSNYIVTGQNTLNQDRILKSIQDVQKIDWRDRLVLIFVDSPSSSLPGDIAEQVFSEALLKKQVEKCLVINGKSTNPHINYFESLKQFMDDLEFNPIDNSIIYIIGREEAYLKTLSDYLSEIVNPIRLEVDLAAILNNIEFYKSKTNPVNKVMAMVKANAYGHGLIEVAHHLKDKVNYLGVAYVNEGISLRREKIKTPIMVMNPALNELDLCVKYDLEPEIYNLPSLIHLDNILEKRKAKAGIHVELDTGMNRLGFELGEVDELIQYLKKSKYIKVNGLYSHLACAEDAKEDEFNKQQQAVFFEIATKIETALDITSIKHVRNSAGTLRYPDSSTDMVRLGIGIYGVDSNNLYQDELNNVSDLKTEISQIRTVKQGETIGYNRTFTAEKDMTIATIAIGYADGFKRIFSNGVGTVLIQGEKVPVVGRVNMDMTMVDVTGLPVNIGDEVIIFNEDLSPMQLAKKAGTIPYEIFTSIGERVNRIFTIHL